MATAALVVQPGHHLNGKALALREGARFLYLQPPVPALWEGQPDAPVEAQVLDVRRLGIGGRIFQVATPPATTCEEAVLALIDAPPNITRAVEVPL